MERESLLGGIQRLSRPSETNPNMLEDPPIEIVSKEESSIESLDVDENLECVFATAFSIKSIVMMSEEMNTDKTDLEDLEDLITQAEAEIELNPMELIQLGNAEYMKQLQRNLDGCFKDCLQ